MFFKMVALLICVIATPASACRFTKQAELGDIFQADAVIVGGVEEYKIIEVEFGDGGPRPAHVRFVVRVKEVVAGDVSSGLRHGDRLTVTSGYFVFGLSEHYDGRKSFLFALRAPHSSPNPIKSGTTPMVPNQEPGEFAVLQALCSKGFIFDANGPTGTVLQQVLETDRDQANELKILQEFVLERQPFSKMKREIYALELEVHKLKEKIVQIEEAARRQ